MGLWGSLAAVNYRPLCCPSSLKIFCAYALCCMARYSFCAATSSWQTRIVDISFSPIRRYKISLLPASVSKYQEWPLLTSGMGVGQFSAPMYKAVVPSGLSFHQAVHF